MCVCVCVFFPRKSPSDVTSVIDAGEVTFPRSSASARVCEERLVVHLSRRSTGFDTPWLVTELSSRTQRVLMYIIYASYTCARERVCVCVWWQWLWPPRSSPPPQTDPIRCLVKQYIIVVGSTHNITLPRFIPDVCIVIVLMVFSSAEARAAVVAVSSFITYMGYLRRYVCNKYSENVYVEIIALIIIWYGNGVGES